MKRKQTLWNWITERLQLAALRVNFARISLRLAGEQEQDVMRYVAYYRARVPGLRLRPNPINGDLMWTGLCPVCQLQPIWVGPWDGGWVCGGACSSQLESRTAVELEYMLSGEDCEATVQRLMDQAA